MLNALLELIGIRKTDAQLEDEALWCQNTGEPRNPAAKELCRRWGEYECLDVHDAPRAQAQQKDSNQ